MRDEDDYKGLFVITNRDNMLYNSSQGKTYVASELSISDFDTRMYVGIL